jgi:hypothetical protein
MRRRAWAAAFGAAMTAVIASPPWTAPGAARARPTTRVVAPRGDELVAALVSSTRHLLRAAPLTP